MPFILGDAIDWNRFRLQEIQPIRDPCRAKARTIAAPMPVLAPVTSRVLFAREVTIDTRISPPSFSTREAWKKESPLGEYPRSWLYDDNPSCNRIVLSSEATSHLFGAEISPNSSSSLLSTSFPDP